MKKDKVLDGKAVIVKYENRKLYNRNTASYINLTELLALGVGKFVVVDNVTKADITDEVVLAALFNEYKDKPSELVEIITEALEQVENPAGVEISEGVN